MIHASALVHPTAQISTDVSIGPFSVIGPGVSIGPRSEIGSHCIIGEPSSLARSPELVLGEDSRVRSHSVIYAGSNFGPGLETGHRVTIRENTQAGQNLRLGTLTDVQGDCIFGDFVRLHSNVHVGKGSSVGNFVWIFPYVVLTNDPHPPSDLLLGSTLEDYCVIATMSVVLPGIRVGAGAVVGAMSLVNRDVPGDTLVAGTPARYRCMTSEVRLKDGTDGDAYPWRRHFQSGYPEGVKQEWENEFRPAGAQQSEDSPECDTSDG